MPLIVSQGFVQLERAPTSTTILVEAAQPDRALQTEHHHLGSSGPAKEAPVPAEIQWLNRAPRSTIILDLVV